MQIGPRECAAGMAGLRKARHRFTGQTDIDDLIALFGKVREEIRLQISHVLAAVGDAVAQENNPPGIRQPVAARCRENESR